MFCAVIRPVPLATTDFGEMSPPIDLMSRRRVRSDGGPTCSGVAAAASAVLAAVVAASCVAAVVFALGALAAVARVPSSS